MADDLLKKKLSEKEKKIFGDYIARPLDPPAPPSSDPPPEPELESAPKQDKTIKDREDKLIRFNRVPFDRPQYKDTGLREKLDAINSEYNKAKDEANSKFEGRERRTLLGQLAESLGQALTQMAAGYYGLKHGVDATSGIKFNKTDWERHIDRNLSRFHKDVSLAERERGAEERTAHSAERKARQEFESDLNQKWREHQANESARLADNQLQLRQLDKLQRDSKLDDGEKLELRRSSKRIDSAGKAMSTLSSLNNAKTEKERNRFKIQLRKHAVEAGIPEATVEELMEKKTEGYIFGWGAEPDRNELMQQLRQSGYNEYASSNKLLKGKGKTSLVIPKSFQPPEEETEAAAEIGENEVVREVEGKQAVFDKETKKFIRWVDGQ